MARETWTEDELRAAVEAYVEMHRREAAGEKVAKHPYYERLSSTFGRTEKAWEYRMQNISYVYSLQGRQWVTGLKPASHVGANVTATLERLIEEAEGQALGAESAFQAKVEGLRKRKQPPEEPPSGSSNPGSSKGTVTRYERDPAVAAWVLEAAGGHCECCGGPAPFLGVDGEPFMEVHHVQRLADGGPDTINNAVALCPNCHRELHYGAQKDRLRRSVVQSVLRLNDLEKRDG